MPLYKFITIRDLNTFSTVLKKNWWVEVECIANNNPLLLMDDRTTVALAIEEKYHTVCAPISINLHNFKVEKIENKS